MSPPSYLDVESAKILDRKSLTVTVWDPSQLKLSPATQRYMDEDRPGLRPPFRLWSPSRIVSLMRWVQHAEKTTRRGLVPLPVYQHGSDDKSGNRQLMTMLHVGVSSNGGDDKLDSLDDALFFIVVMRGTVNIQVRTAAHEIKEGQAYFCNVGDIRKLMCVSKGTCLLPVLMTRVANGRVLQGAGDYSMCQLMDIYLQQQLCRIGPFQHVTTYEAATDPTYTHEWINVLQTMKSTKVPLQIASQLLGGSRFYNSDSTWEALCDPLNATGDKSRYERLVKRFFSGPGLPSNMNQLIATPRTRVARKGSLLNDRAGAGAAAAATNSPPSDSWDSQSDSCSSEEGSDGEGESTGDDGTSPDDLDRAQQRCSTELPVTQQGERNWPLRPDCVLTGTSRLYSPTIFYLFEINGEYVGLLRYRDTVLQFGVSAQSIAGRSCIPHRDCPTRGQSMPVSS
jgi:hypothetical protein